MVQLWEGAAPAGTGRPKGLPLQGGAAFRRGLWGFSLAEFASSQGAPVAEASKDVGNTELEGGGS